MIGNPGELATTVGVHYPHIGVAVLVILLTRAIRNKGDALAVGRPLRIAVVPVVALRDLFRFARLDINNPKMCAAIVEPAGVVEFVRGVFVMADVTAVFGITGARITGTNAADDDQTSSVR